MYYVCPLKSVPKTDGKVQNSPRTEKHSVEALHQEAPENDAPCEKATITPKIIETATKSDMVGMKRSIPSSTTAKDAESEIVELLKEHPNGVASSKMFSFYEEKYKKQLDIKQWGYYSIIEFLSKFNGGIVITRPQKTSDWIVSVREEKDKGLQSVSYVEEEEIQVLKLEIRELLLRAGKEIVLEKLPEMYERTYRHRINNIEDGDRLALMDLVLKIHGASITCDGDKLMTTVHLNKKMRSQIPADTVGPKASYRLPTLPTVEDQYIDVYVADVTDPGCFSIQIYGRKTTGALNELMDALEEFYCSLDTDKYDLPEHMVRPGQICAAMFMEDLNWHRAVIIGEYDRDFADILYVDYGTVATVPVSSLKLLKSCFLTLPTQMIKARLAHIRPRNLKEWTLQARNDMLSFCRNKQLIALISDVRNDVLSLCLCDTTDPDTDVHVNDTLVDMKHAVVFPDSLNLDEQQRLAEFYEKQFEAKKNGFDVDVDSSVLEFLQETSATLCEDQSLSSSYVPLQEQPGSIERNPTSVPVHEQMSSLAESMIGDINSQANVPANDSNTSHSVTCEDNKSGIRQVRRYVQRHHILGGAFSLHVINYCGEPMVNSFEISQWFGQTSDALRPLICMKSLDISETIVVNDEKHVDLFDSVEEFQVPRIVERKLLSDVLCLYHLRDVVTIIAGLGHKHQNQMIQDIIKILVNFDISSDYWYSDIIEARQEEEILDNLESQRSELIAARIVLLEELAEKSNPKIVDKITEMESKISEITKKIESTNPKNIANQQNNADTKNENGVKNFDFNPFLQSTKPTVDIPKKERPAEADPYADDCPPLTDVTKYSSNVAEVLPFQQKIQDIGDEDLSVIPRPQMHHDLVEFTPGNSDHQHFVHGQSGQLVANISHEQDSNTAHTQNNSSVTTGANFNEYLPTQNTSLGNRMFVQQQQGYTPQYTPFPPMASQSPMALQPLRLVPVPQNASLYRDTHGRLYFNPTLQNAIYNSGGTPQRTILPAPANRPVYLPRVNYQQ